MNKKELVDTVSHKSKLTKDQSGKVVNEILNSISEALAKGDEVKINGFGASKVLQFKAAKVLEDFVNQRDFIENFLETGKVTYEEAHVLRYVVEESRKAADSSLTNSIETKKIAKDLDLRFQEAERIANRLIGKRILNTEVYTSQIDSVFLRANYGKYL